MWCEQLRRDQVFGQEDKEEVTSWRHIRAEVAETLIHPRSGTTDYLDNEGSNRSCVKQVVLRCLLMVKYKIIFKRQKWDVIWSNVLGHGGKQIFTSERISKILLGITYKKQL